jgi:nucleotide-binding universal stress UspA family protein
MIWERVLLALDQDESGQAALRFTTELATATHSDVRVLHLRTLSKWARVAPLETPDQAEDLVREAVLTMRLAGLGAEGRSRSVSETQVGLRIVEESLYWVCDAIVLGTRRRHGIGRFSGGGVRERVVRWSPLPVLTAPPALRDALHDRFRSGTTQLGHGDSRRTCNGEDT